MALYRVRAVLVMNSGAFADRAVWSWGVDSPTVPDAAAIAALLAARWTTIIPLGSVQMRTLVPTYATVEQIDVYPAAGGDVLDSAPLALAGTGSAHPAQLTAPVSWLVAGTGGPRPLGRWSFGPISSVWGTTRPGATQMINLLRWCQDWHGALDGAGYTQVVLRAAGTASSPILGFDMPNAFGTMRTRAWERTTRTVVML